MIVFSRHKPMGNKVSYNFNDLHGNTSLKFKYIPDKTYQVQQTHYRVFKNLSFKNTQNFNAGQRISYARVFKIVITDDHTGKWYFWDEHEDYIYMVFKIYDDINGKWATKFSMINPELPPDDVLDVFKHNTENHQGNVGLQYTQI
jgi:hypothetical protein